MMTDLKPCPECGAECYRFRLVYSFAVGCTQCCYTIVNASDASVARLHNSIPRD